MSYNIQEWFGFISLTWNPWSSVMQEVCGITQSFSTQRKVIILWHYHYSSHLGFNGASGAGSQPWQTPNYIFKLSEPKVTHTTHTTKWHKQHTQQSDTHNTHNKGSVSEYSLVYITNFHVTWQLNIFIRGLDSKKKLNSSWTIKTTKSE